MDTIITIDGPAGAGKSTISKLVAKKMGFVYLDTGAMYRAVALMAKRSGIDFSDGSALKVMCSKMDMNFVPDGDTSKLFLGDEDISLAIRSPDMDMRASSISAVMEVRAAMTELQRKLGGKGKLVAEGRDMGTVVFSNTEHKFFLTASVEERAQRRFAERKARGESIDIESIKVDMQKRDEQDSSRAIAPLHPAEDAFVIDTDSLTIDQVVGKILTQIRLG